MKRHWITLLVAMLFVTIAVTGIMGFFLPFNLKTVSIHALSGFIFICVISFHIRNNFTQLKSYCTKPSIYFIGLLVLCLVFIITLQPKPIRAIMGLSNNNGPDPDHFEIHDKRLMYRYDPAPHYRMRLEVIGGSVFNAQQPPSFAIWVENRSGYHIASLHHTNNHDSAQQLPYWHYKRSEYLKYKQRYEEMSEAERKAEIDALSSATENDSFDPADYIVPKDPAREVPFRVMIEINQLHDSNKHYADQPSLIYAVEVDNRDPKTFQVFDLVGFSKSDVRDGETHWDLHYIDETITSAHDLIDSALLQIERDTQTIAP